MMQGYAANKRGQELINSINKPVKVEVAPINVKVKTCGPYDLCAYQ